MNGIYQFVVERQEGATFYIDNTNLPVILSSWYQVVIIVDFTTLSFHLIVNGNNGMGKADFQSSSILSTSLTCNIGGGANSGLTQFDNFRVYRGELVTSHNSCWLQVETQIPHCLICQSGFFLSIQNQMQCVPQSAGTDTDKDNILDWNNRTSCQYYQTYSTSLNSCICIKQMYFDGTKCVLCPSYCQGCLSQTVCLKIDSNRDSISGICQYGMFDDGFNCLASNYSIFYQNNFKTFLPEIGTSTFLSYLFTGSDLNWNGEQPFLLCFSVSLKESSPSNYAQILAYVKDGIEDVFSIVDEFAFSSLQHQICFYYHSTVLSCFQVEPTWVWIGLWTNFQEVIISVFNLGASQQKIDYIDGLFSLIDPTVCIGQCVDSAHTFSLFNGVIQNFFVFIRGKFNSYSLFNFLYLVKEIFFHEKEMNDFFLQRESSDDIFLEYNSLNVIQGSTLLGINIASNSIQRLFQFSTTDYHLLKGFHFQQNSQGDFLDILEGKELSLSLNIFFIGFFHQGFEVFTFEINGLVISYRIWIIGVEKNEFTFKICIKTCLVTSNCRLFGGTPNFLFIIMRDLEPESLEITTYQFQVVCNYNKDVLLFRNSKQNYSYDKLKIQIPTIFYSQTDYHINNIRIFVGSDFYFDYSQRTNCFIYYDVANIKCLKAKQNYAAYQGEVVLPIDCYKYGSLFQGVVYNKFTMECVNINSIILGCMIYSDDLATCLQCKDPNAILSSDCLTCDLGYFKLSQYDICQRNTIHYLKFPISSFKACHMKCLTCISYDQCYQCKYVSAIPPECDCILPLFRDPITFQCKNCSLQCETCKGSPNQCLTCTNPNLTAPFCQCNPNIFSLNSSTHLACIPKICSPQCLTCEHEPSNCVICSPNRVDPPACDCISNYFEISFICKTCKYHFFYNYITNQCEECHPNCKECKENKYQCTQCINELILLNSTCLCQDLSSFYLAQNEEIKCQEMNVSFKLEIENEQYYLIFTFEEIIDEIDFSHNPIDNLIYLYISNIDQSSFTLDSAIFKEKVLKLHLKFVKSFSAQNGSILFLINQSFVSSQAQKVLSFRYTQIPFQFKIGPLLISGEVLQSNGYVNAALNTIKGQNKFLLSLIRQFQVIFQILNTLQPCVVFLMVSIILPPNLFQYLEAMGLLIFPRVTNSQTVEQQQEEFSIFGFQLDIPSNSSRIFNKLGFSSSILVNIPFMIVSYLLWPCLLFLTFIIMKLSTLDHKIQTAYKIRLFILERMNSNCETALLITSTAIFNQFLNLDSTSYLHRWSLYLAIFLLFIIFNFYWMIYKGMDLKEQKGDYNYFQMIKKTLSQKYDFQNRSKSIKTFFFLQVSKKYILSMIIVFIEKYPSVLCGSSAALFFISTISVIWLRPYQIKIRNLMKIIGEVCMTLVWILFLIKFVSFQDNLKENEVILNEAILSFLQYGEIALWILVFFNLIYLLDFIIFEFIFKLWNLCSGSSQSQSILQLEKYKQKPYIQNKEVFMKFSLLKKESLVQQHE